MPVSPAGRIGRSGHNRFIHMDSFTPLDGELCIASWNVEGLSEIKLWELTSSMRRKSISVLCIQETRRSKTPYFYTEEGFLVILSGSSSEEKEWAGVGFIVAPWAVQSIVGFLQHSNRLACLKLRIPGGKLALVSAYAPHSGYAFDIRQEFFEELGTMFKRTSVNGPKYIFGDLNSRIQRQMPGEETVFGDHVFGNPLADLGLGSNRELLLEFLRRTWSGCSQHFLAEQRTRASHLQSAWGFANGGY